jgi:hypothetical protein
VSDAGIAGLERLPSLTSLSLASCRSITNVTHLFRSKSLRRLVLSWSSVTDAGLVGLQLAPALEFVQLRNCAGIADAASVVLRAAERSVKVLVCGWWGARSLSSRRYYGAARQTRNLRGSHDETRPSTTQSNSACAVSLNKANA